MPVLQRLPFATDQGSSPRARLGLLVLQSDQTIEAELRQLTALEGVGLFHARLANDTDVTPGTLAQMAAELPRAANLLPRYLGLNALAYGCTSGATVIGEEEVARILARSHPDVPATNPLSAAKAALGRLGVSRLALLTPYAPDVTEAMQANFDAAGITVTGVGAFHERDDRVVGRIDPTSVLEATLQIGAAADCDGVFVSCTSLRTAGLIAEAEARLGKPVTASNHALAWHLLRLAGIDDAQTGFGRLFEMGLDDG